MLPPFFISTKAAVNTANNYLTINRPDFTDQGDFLICAIAWAPNATTPNITTSIPTGWNLAFKSTYNNTDHLDVWWKYISNPIVDEPTSYTWGRLRNAEKVGRILCFRYADVYDGILANYSAINRSLSYSHTPITAKICELGTLHVNQELNLIVAVLRVWNRVSIDSSYPQDVFGLNWTNSGVLYTGSYSSDTSICMAYCVYPQEQDTEPINFRISYAKWGDPYYAGGILEIAAYENAHPPAGPGGGSAKTPATEEEKLLQQGARSRYLEYSRSQRSNLYLPVDRKYNLSRGYKNPPMPIVGQGR